MKSGAAKRHSAKKTYLKNDVAIIELNRHKAELQALPIIDVYAHKLMMMCLCAHDDDAQYLRMEWIRA